VFWYYYVLNVTVKYLWCSQCCYYMAEVDDVWCRLAFSVIWEMTPDANVIDVKYCKTVIKSQVVNLILFTVLCLAHITSSHSHLHFHHLSLPRPFTPDLKLICFTNPSLHGLLVSSGLPFRTHYLLELSLATIVEVNKLSTVVE